jgi:hypothetical protein
MEYKVCGVFSSVNFLSSVIFVIIKFLNGGLKDTCT